MNEETKVHKAENPALNKGVVMRCDYLKNEVYKVLTKSPDDWEIDRFNAHHKPTGLSYWIANGFLCFKNDGNGLSVNIGFYNRLKLWWWIQDCKMMKVIKSVS
jgi:hypothetical protein